MKYDKTFDMWYNNVDDFIKDNYAALPSEGELTRIYNELPDHKEDEPIPITIKKKKNWLQRFRSKHFLRMQALWFVLTNKNFILIHNIQEFEDKNGQKCQVLRRTDYSAKRDLYAMLAAIHGSFGIGFNTDELDMFFDKDGKTVFQEQEK